MSSADAACTRYTHYTRTCSALETLAGHTATSYMGHPKSWLLVQKFTEDYSALEGHGDAHSDDDREGDNEDAEEEDEETEQCIIVGIDSCRVFHGPLKPSGVSQGDDDEMLIDVQVGMEPEEDEGEDEDIRDGRRATKNAECMAADKASQFHSALVVTAKGDGRQSDPNGQGILAGYFLKKGTIIESSSTKRGVGDIPVHLKDEEYVEVSGSKEYVRKHTVETREMGDVRCELREQR